MAVRESSASRLRALKQVVEELGARREAGFNHFTRDEYAVQRLLNALDDLLNTDTEEEGALIMFLTQAVRDTLPYATLTHKPLEKVHERNLPTKLEASRYWIICALNMPGALKETLQRTLLEAKDILMGYYAPQSLLFDEAFLADFFTTLALLQTPPVASGPTEFQLDVTALQLFYQRAKPVEFVRVKTKSSKDKSASGSGGGDGHKHHRHHHAPGDSPPPSGPGVGGESTRRHHHGHRATNGEGTSVSVQTVLEGKHLLIKGMNVENDDDDDAPLLSMPIGGRAASPLRPVGFAESWCQTEQPSPSISFNDFCRMSQEQKEKENQIKATMKKAKELEAQWTEKNAEISERLEAVLAVLVATRSIYNEVMVTKGEAEMRGEDLEPEDIHPLVPKILAVVFQKAEVVKGGKAIGSSSGVTSASTQPSQQQQQQQQSAQKGRSAPAPTQSNPPHASNSFASAPFNVTVEDDDDLNSPPESPSAGKSGVQRDKSMLGSSEGDPLETKDSSFNLTALLNAAKSAGPAPLSRQSGQIIVGGDLPPSAPVGNLPLHITIPVEKERDSQLRLQNNQCAKCEAKFPAAEKNVVFKIVSRTASALTMQKPRRCHYCCALYCHNCHTNKMMILPFKVFQRWDFTVQHVCNGCYDFLTANVDRPLYSLKQLPKELQTRPNIVAAVKLRKQMVALNKVVSECRDIPSALQTFTASHYFTREDYFSLADFTRLRGGDSKLAEMNPLQMVLGSQEDLLAVLAAMFKKMKQHVMDCRPCNARAAAKCLICNEAKPVMVFEEDGMACAKCGTIYHKGCYDAIGCKKCGN